MARCLNKFYIYCMIPLHFSLCSVQTHWACLIQIQLMEDVADVTIGEFNTPQSIWSYWSICIIFQQWRFILTWLMHSCICVQKSLAKLFWWTLWTMTTVLKCACASTMDPPLILHCANHCEVFRTAECDLSHLFTIKQQYANCLQALIIS